MFKRNIKKLCIFMTIGLLLSACSNNNKSSVNNEDILILKNANLIDGTGAPTKANSYILIEKGRIKEIGTKNQVKIPSGANVVNLKGASVLPGFINAHVHQAYKEENLKNWLNAGVTTVRCLSPGTEEDFIKKRDELNKDVNNSYTVSSNPILKVEGGYGSGSGVVSSPEDARKKVLDYIDKGVSIIKFALEDNLPPGNFCELMPNDYVKNIVDAAHSKNVKVSVHISRTKNLKPAIDAGVDDIAHMVVDDLDSDTINAIIQKNIYITPTLELWNGVGWGDRAVSNLSMFYKAGGKIALGTDFAGHTIPFDKGFPIKEVNLMKEAGMSNMDIIIAATKNAAYVCDLDKEIGTVEVGKKADLLIVNGDPLTDINALKNTKMVIHNGTIVKDSK